MFLLTMDKCFFFFFLDIAQFTEIIGVRDKYMLFLVAKVHMRRIALGYE